jgi:hypothetical protein
VYTLIYYYSIAGYAKERSLILMKRFAIDLGVGFDRVWGDVRLPSVGYANDFGGGLGSIYFRVGGFDRV